MTIDWMYWAMLALTVVVFNVVFWALIYFMDRISERLLYISASIVGLATLLVLSAIFFGWLGAFIVIAVTVVVFGYLMVAYRLKKFWSFFFEKWE